MLGLFELIASKGIFRPYRENNSQPENLSSLIMLLGN